MEETLLDLNFDTEKLTPSIPSYYALEQLIVAQNYKIQRMESIITTLLHSVEEQSVEIKTLKKTVEILVKKQELFTITIQYVDYEKRFYQSRNTPLPFDKSLVKTKEIQLDCEELDFIDIILEEKSLDKLKQLSQLKKIRTYGFVFKHYTVTGTEFQRIVLLSINLLNHHMPGFPLIYDPQLNPEQKPLQVTVL